MSGFVRCLVTVQAAVGSSIYAEAYKLDCLLIQRMNYGFSAARDRGDIILLFSLSYSSFITVVFLL